MKRILMIVLLAILFVLSGCSNEKDNPDQSIIILEDQLSTANERITQLEVELTEQNEQYKTLENEMTSNEELINNLKDEVKVQRIKLKISKRKTNH